MRGDGVPDVRPATAGDAMALATLHAGLFDPGWQADAVRSLLAQETTLAFCLNAPGEADLWGFVVGRVAADEAEIITIGVAPKRQGQGLATRLLRSLIEAARHRGARQMFLEVAEGNTAARHLYEAAGFHEAGCRRAYYQRKEATAEDALVLRLDLTPR